MKFCAANFPLATEVALKKPVEKIGVDIKVEIEFSWLANKLDNCQLTGEKKKGLKKEV